MDADTCFQRKLLGILPKHNIFRYPDIFICALDMNTKKEIHEHYPVSIITLKYNY